MTWEADDQLIKKRSETGKVLISMKKGVNRTLAIWEREECTNNLDSNLDYAIFVL